MAWLSPYSLASSVRTCIVVRCTPQLSGCGIPYVCASSIQVVHNLYVGAPCMIHATCIQIYQKNPELLSLTALDTRQTKAEAGARSSSGVVHLMTVCAVLGSGHSWCVCEHVCASTAAQKAALCAHAEAQSFGSATTRTWDGQAPQLICIVSCSYRSSS